ncbi:MAG TPA: alanine racemase C-terminal domain-containing protein, partial [Thermomicrobiales bacterium]|nr:alanine racemase C-terminal domain-containing protein [Thermomicrobiales bacterium]
PSPDRPLPAGARPVLTLRSRVQRVFDLAPGDTVGYGRTFRADRPLRAALVPVGYADGYRRQLANRAWMIVGGERAPVLGRVSMDQTVVAVPPGVDVRVGDEVIVAGGDPALGAPSMDDLGEMVGTNSYEMLTGIPARVPRHYLRHGQIVEIAELEAP